MSQPVILSDFRIPKEKPESVDPDYVELAVTTNFSFLRGASHPREFVEQAAALGYAAIGIADRNSLAGVVRAYDQWAQMDGKERPRLLIGVRLVFRDGTPDILAYPKDRKAYGRLCHLISRGNCARRKANACWISRIFCKAGAACC